MRIGIYVLDYKFLQFYYSFIVSILQKKRLGTLSGNSAFSAIYPERDHVSRYSVSGNSALSGNSACQISKIFGGFLEFGLKNNLRPKSKIAIAT